MIVRQAVADDLPALTLMGMRFAIAARLPKADPDDTFGFFSWMIENPAQAILLAAGGATPVGMIGLLIGPLFFNRRHLNAQELFWWVEPDHRGTPAAVQLLHAAEDQARLAGCGTITMAGLTELRGDIVGRLLGRHGYRGDNQHYVKEL